MKTLEAQVPDILVEEVKELAAKQNVTVDQIVSLALAAQVSAWRTRESIASRKKRVDWQKVDDIRARCQMFLRNPVMNSECNSEYVTNFDEVGRLNSNCDLSPKPVTKDRKNQNTEPRSPNTEPSRASLSRSVGGCFFEFRFGRLTPRPRISAQSVS